MNKIQNRDAARVVLAYYWHHVLRYPKNFIGLLFAVPLTSLINGFLPTLITANILSQLSQHDFQSHDIWGSFGPELVAYAILLFLGIVAWRVVDHFMWGLEINLERDMAEEVHSKLLNQTADFHANNFTGSLVSQNSKLLGSYIRIADATIYTTFPLLTGIIYASTIMFFRAPLFGWLLVIFSVVYISLALVVSRPVRKAGARLASAESEQTGHLADALTNSMAVKSFASGAFERRRFHGATSKTERRWREMSKVHDRQMNILGFTNRAISSSALLVAVITVMFFNAEIGTVFLILSYTASIVDQLFNFGNNGLRTFNRAFGDAKDMVDTLALTPTILDPVKPEPVRIKRGLVTFKDVGFTHDGSEDALFQAFNLRIKPGEKVGLVGHSGSGKTTFTRLLLRFSDIQSGQILIDGQDITAITQDDLRRHIAYVPQEPLLFHRTIRENIAYGQGEVDERAVVAVAKLAHAHEFIETLPHGYDTLVGERGVKLSGGQRQRIAIARAMLKNAPILLLDEATSALASESEVLIQDALWKLMEGRTAIVIAHRLSTIQHMDRIVVLDDGKIVEQGSHKDLIAQNGEYAKLWAHQSGGFMDD